MLYIFLFYVYILICCTYLPTNYRYINTLCVNIFLRLHSDLLPLIYLYINSMYSRLWYPIFTTVKRAEITSRGVFAIQDLVKAQTEGEPKLRSILVLSEDLLTGTSIAGQEMVRRDVDSVQSDWQTFIASCSQVWCFLWVLLTQNHF